MPPTKMVPPELLNTLDSEQLRALVDAYENVLDVARSRLAAAEQSDARARHYAAAAARARAARTDTSRARIRQVIELARRGLSNPEIAERLGVSTRTITRALTEIARLGR